MKRNTDSPCLQLIDAFIEDWRGLTVSVPKAYGGGRDAPKKQLVPQRAYLLFNRWDDNPLAQALEGQFPKWVRDRVIVPDRQFEHRSEHAPFLLELPEELILPSPDFQSRPVRDWLVQCLEYAAQQRYQSTDKQDFCGIVVSSEKPQAIARHWVGLGDQRPPFKDESVLFRYHDPRVMQRVWPALSAHQQSRWLGPVTHWWSLVQPWGPFGGAPETPQWLHAKVPMLPHDVQAGGSPRDLFDEAQWFLAGISPQANLIWRSYAKHHVAPQAQPDVTSLLRMLEDASHLDLAGLDLEDYVWITWQHTPKEGAPHALDWSVPHLAPVLSRIQEQLRTQPGARFSSLWVEAVKATHIKN
ncbi:hypothetical protein M2282_003405 [Variovorax boronicumulans]|uniref:DUF4123 domain-containing protein n=1 Tax=Variovorax boronicumulans TaxID=436515 RepID=UPI002476174C|nr:DUF4123 domain-containing protein [Variovorax boronicumulans]MDH6168254.1 hypothetical protein [Variovorax boronicumulans]